MNSVSLTSIPEVLKVAKEGIEAGSQVAHNEETIKQSHPSSSSKERFTTAVVQTVVDRVFDAANTAVGTGIMGPPFVLVQAANELKDTLSTPQKGSPSTLGVVGEVMGSALHVASKPIDTVAELLGHGREETTKAVAAQVAVLIDETAKGAKKFGSEIIENERRQADRHETAIREVVQGAQKVAGAVACEVKAFGKEAVENERRKGEQFENTVRAATGYVKDFLSTPVDRTGTSSDLSYRAEIPLEKVDFDHLQTDSPCAKTQKQPKPKEAEISLKPPQPQADVSAPPSRKSSQGPLQTGDNKQATEDAPVRALSRPKIIEDHEVKFSLQQYAQEFTHIPSIQDRMNFQLKGNTLQATCTLAGQGASVPDLTCTDIERFVSSASRNGVGDIQVALRIYNRIQIDTYFLMKLFNPRGIVRQANRELNGRGDWPQVKALELSDGSRVLLWTHHRHKDFSAEIASCDPRLAQFVQNPNQPIITRSQEDTERQAKAYFEGLLTKFHQQCVLRDGLGHFVDGRYDQAEPLLAQVAAADPSNKRVHDALTFIQARREAEKVASDPKVKLDSHVTVTTKVIVGEKMYCVGCPQEDTSSRSPQVMPLRPLDFIELHGATFSLPPKSISPQAARAFNAENLAHMMFTGSAPMPGFFHTNKAGETTFRVNMNLPTYAPLIQHVAGNFELYAGLAKAAAEKIGDGIAYTLAKSAGTLVRTTGVLCRWVYNACSDTEWNHEDKVKHHKAVLCSIASTVKDASRYEKGIVQRCFDAKGYLKGSINPSLTQICDLLLQRKGFVDQAQAIFCREKVLHDRNEQRTALFHVTSTKNVINGSVKYTIGCLDEMSPILNGMTEVDTRLLTSFRDAICQLERDALATELGRLEPLLQRRLNPAASQAALATLRGGMTLWNPSPDAFDGLFYVYAEEFMQQLRGPAHDVVNSFQQLGQIFATLEERYQAYVTSEDDLKRYYAEEKEMNFFQSLFHFGEGKLKHTRRQRREALKASLRECHYYLLYRDLLHLSPQDPLFEEKTALKQLLEGGQIEDPLLRHTVSALLPALSRSPLYEGEESWLRLGVVQRELFGPCGDLPSYAARLLSQGFKDTIFLSQTAPQVILEGVQYKHHREIPDGNCCYRSIASALLRVQERGEALNPNELAIVQADTPHDMARKRCAHWIRAQRHHPNFETVLADGIVEYRDILQQVIRQANSEKRCVKHYEEALRDLEANRGNFDGSVELYCHMVETQGTWADRTLLISLSHMMQRPLHIHQVIETQNVVEVIGGQYAAQRAFHLFFTGDHYDFLEAMPQANATVQPAVQQRLGEQELAPYCIPLPMSLTSDPTDGWDFAVENTPHH